MQGRKVVIRGAKTSSVKLISNNAINLVVNHGAEFRFLQVHKLDHQFIIPTCTLSDTGDSVHSVPNEITLLLNVHSELTPKGEPESILARKMVKRGCVAATKVLVKWKNRDPELAT